MGTDVRVLAPRDRARRAAQLAESVFAEWEARLSRFRPESELSRVNARAGSPVRAGRILLDTAASALAAARATGGLFDPLLETQLRETGYDRPFDAITGAMPSPSASPRTGGGWRNVVLDRNAGTVTVPSGYGLDLGGIAKGMAVDESIERLRNAGIGTALVSAGGDLRVLGLPDEGHWDILVGEDPGGPVVQLLRGALATSGTARRRWRQGHEARHHLARPTHGIAGSERPRAGDGRGVDLPGRRGRRHGRVCGRTQARPLAARAARRRRPSRHGHRQGDHRRPLAPAATGPRGVTSWSAITWETARAAGLVSYALLTTTVAIGLVLGSRFQSKRWPRRVSNELHGYVSLLALVFIVIHVLAVAIDPFTHFGVAGVLVPFVSHYRPLWTALGIVTLYLLAAVWVSTALRRRIGHRLWRRIHLLAFVIYAAGTLHGLGAGSDTRTVWALAVYTTSVTIVGSLVAARLLVPAGREARPRAAALAGLGLVAAVAWSVIGPLDASWGKHRAERSPGTAVVSAAAAATTQCRERQWSPPSSFRRSPPASRGV